MKPRPCTSHEGRRCSDPECSTLLSYVNPGPLCFAHQEIAKRKLALAEGRIEFLGRQRAGYLGPIIDRQELAVA